jgi:hypothetical protein
MKNRKFPQDQNQEPATFSRLFAAPIDQSGIDFTPATDDLGGKACSNCANQGSPIGQEEKRQEAEARLFGGIVRETQMRPGSSLFKTETYKQDSTATIKESLNE